MGRCGCACAVSKLKLPTRGPEFVYRTLHLDLDQMESDSAPDECMPSPTKRVDSDMEGYMSCEGEPGYQVGEDRLVTPP